jgi:hypothetical protein
LSSKFLSQKSYEHRSYFFRVFGEQLVNASVEKYSQLYPQVYTSSPPKRNDFESISLFDFIEYSLYEHIDSDFKIDQDHGLLTNCQLKFFSPQKREALLDQYSGFSQYDNFPFYPTGIPIQIRELLKENTHILEEYYKACINSHIEQFYIRGRVSKYWISLDTIYRDGFKHHLAHFGNKSIEEIDVVLQRFTEGGIYGLLSNADLYTPYETLENKQIEVQLLKFNFSGRGYEEPLKTNTLLLDLDLSPMKYIPNENHLDKYIDSQYEPNNIVRDLLHLPRLGEGWISETKLYYQLKEYFKNDVVLQHIKPKWLGRQHYDIYFPFLNIAVEYQGKQHFEPVSYFGGSEAFKRNIERDNRKKKLSEKNNCDLFYVEPGYDIDDVIEKIRLSKNYTNKK